jgi:hypothetical protein
MSWSFSATKVGDVGDMGVPLNRASGAEEEPVTIAGEAQGGGFADPTAGAGDQDCL